MCMQRISSLSNSTTVCILCVAFSKREPSVNCILAIWCRSWQVVPSVVLKQWTMSSSIQNVTTRHTHLHGHSLTKPGLAGCCKKANKCFHAQHKAVIDRRLRPWCCHLGSYFKHMPLPCHYICRGMMCKHDVIHIHCGLVGPACKK